MATVQHSTLIHDEVHRPKRYTLVHAIPDITVVHQQYAVAPLGYSRLVEARLIIAGTIATANEVVTIFDSGDLHILATVTVPFAGSASGSQYDAVLTASPGNEITTGTGCIIVTSGSSTGGVAGWLTTVWEDN